MTNGWKTQARKLLYQTGLLPKTQGQHITALPDPQNALDILQGEWRSKLPAPLTHLQAGDLALFEDNRIMWLIERIGGVDGLSVLELGPLEGAHTYMLEAAGAAQITAIEANTTAYLKCLIVKELLGMTRASFLCGDFMGYLRAETAANFDLGVASGVLYHMQNPAELLTLLANHCNRHLFLWTHYYDESLIARNPAAARKTKQKTATTYTYEGFEHTLYRYEYQEGRYMLGFSGAGTAYTNWMSRTDIIRCLNYVGFGQIQTAFEEPNHKHGPAFALIASRT